MKSTRKDYEDYLNELFTDCYSVNEAIDRFCCLNDGKIRESTIIHYHNNHILGTLFRKHDPIAFNTGYNEWCQSKRR